MANHPRPKIGQLVFSYIIPNNPEPETDPELLVWKVVDVVAGNQLPPFPRTHELKDWFATIARTLPDDTLINITVSHHSFGTEIFFTPTNALYAKEREYSTLANSHLINYRIHLALVNKLRHMTLAATELTRRLKL